MSSLSAFFSPVVHDFHKLCTTIFLKKESIGAGGPSKFQSSHIEYIDVDKCKHGLGFNSEIARCVSIV